MAIKRTGIQKSRRIGPYYMPIESEWDFVNEWDFVKVQSYLPSDFFYSMNFSDALQAMPAKLTVTPGSGILRISYYKRFDIFHGSSI